MNDDILTKFMLGETSNDEDLSVNQWMREDPKNEKYFKDLKLIWETSKKFATKSNVDENKAWDSFKEKRKKRENQKTKVISIATRVSWIKIAATVLLLIAAGAVFYNIFRSEADLPVAIINVRSTNEVVTKTLSDGSTVTLNKNSSVSYPEKFRGNKREIVLEQGEAFFNVTPDKAKPFIVETNEASIRVVGTSFNVKGDKDKIEVIVETGIVRVSKKEAEVRLEAREMVTIEKTNERIVKERNRDQLYNYYRTNILKADNTPLWRVVEILNEAYGANIVIEGKYVRDLPLTTTFKMESSLDNVLEIIGETLNIKIIRMKDKIILK